MAVAFGALGTVTANGAVASIAIPYPSGITSGQLLVMVVMPKLGPTSQPDLSADGWTSRGFVSHGTTASGNDAGSMRAMVYTKEASGSESGSYTFNFGTNPNAGQSFIFRATKGTGSWDVAVATAVRTATTTSWSVTADSNPGITSGDLVFVASAVPTDLNTASSAGTLTATGLTAGSATEQITHDPSSSGSDCAIWMDSFAPTSGTASAAPAYSSTLTGGTNLYGVSVFIRLRENTVTTVTGDAAPSGNGSLAAAGVVIVPAASTLSGDGSLAGTSLLQAMGDAALSASATLSASSETIVEGSTDLSSSGTLGVSGEPIFVGASDLSGSGTLSASGEVILSAPALLARATIVTPTGTDNDGYWEGSPAANKTWDMRNFTALGYFDCDATAALDLYPTGRFNSPSSPTAHQTNSRPIRLGYTTPSTAPGIIGAKVEGDQPTTLGWTDLKHGSYIQGLIDDGMDPDLAWAEIIGNANMDGDPRVHFANGSWAVVDGVRAKNTWDGFGVYGNGTRTATGYVFIRNLWVLGNRDDGIENDEQRGLHISDSLFENAHSFISTRANDETGSPLTANTQIVEDCVIHLVAGAGGHKTASDVFTSGYFYKMQTNSPYLVMRNTILAYDGTPNYADGPMLPARSDDVYENVSICWLGEGTYPGNTPTGTTLYTGATAQSMIDNAIVEWKVRHGVIDFDTVDMSKMIAPAAVGSPTSAMTSTSGMSVAGVVVQGSSADLTGSADLTAGGAVTAFGSAALDSVGSLEATPLASSDGAADLSGSADLAVSGIPVMVAASALDATSTLAATGDTLAITGSASLESTSTLAAAGEVVVPGSSALSASSDLTATSPSSGGSFSGGYARVPYARGPYAGGIESEAPTGQSGSANLSASSDLSATGLKVVVGSADPSGSSNLTVAGIGVAVGDASLTGEATLLADPSTRVEGSAALSGEGTLVVDSSLTVMLSAALSGSGTLDATGVVVWTGASALSGGGTLAATGSRTIPGEAALTATTNLDAYPFPRGSAQLTGQSDLVVTGEAVKAGAASLSGSGSLTVTGYISLHAAAAQLSSTSGMSPSGLGFVSSPVVLTASTNVYANHLEPGAAQLSAQTNLVANGTTSWDTPCAMSGASNMVTNGLKVAVATSVQTASATLSATGGKIQVSTGAALSASGVLTATATIVNIAELSGSGVLQADPLMIRVKGSNLSGNGSLAVVGDAHREVELSGASNLSCTAIKIVFSTGGALGGKGYLNCTGVTNVTGAPVEIQGSTHGYTNGSSLSLVAPEGRSGGSLLIGVFICDHNVNITVPNTWDVIDRRDVVVSELDQGCVVVKRIADGTSNDNLTLVSTGVEIAGGIIAFQSVSSTVTANVETNHGGPRSANIVLPAATVSSSNGYIVYAALAGSNSGHNVTMGPGTGALQFREATIYFDVAVSVLTTAGAELAKSATTTSSSSCWAGYSLALDSVFVPPQNPWLNAGSPLKRGRFATKMNQGGAFT